MARRDAPTTREPPPPPEVEFEAVDWLQAPWRRLSEARANGRLPHALLINGSAGLGKRLLARRLVGVSLCRKDADPPCGECRGCRLLAAGNHPDLYSIQPEEGKRTISVDQIRQLTRSLALQSHAGGATMVVIHPAEAMTPNAANSLLKTLEEPGDDVVIVLLSNRPNALPVTVRSRCQQIRLLPPPADAGIRWLERAGGEADWRPLLAASGGAPLLALADRASDPGSETVSIGEDLLGLAKRRLEPIGVARRWAAQDPAPTLATLQHTVLDVLRARLAPSRMDAGALAGERLLARLQHVDATRISDYLNEIQEARELLLGQANPQLLCESLLVGWARLTAPQSG